MRFVYPDVSVDKTLMIDRFRRSDQSNIVFSIMQEGVPVSIPVYCYAY